MGVCGGLASVCASVRVSGECAYVRESERKLTLEHSLRHPSF